MHSDTTLIELFSYETGNKQLSDVINVKLAVKATVPFQTWHGNKRALTTEDVISGQWVKTCTAGYITELSFNQDGRVDEFRLFDRFHTKGNWTLEHGILSVQIMKGENQYQFDVVGNSDVNIHSAIERKNGRLHSYLKLMQIK
ncbi:hypothetical protein [Vibrio ulleungensis]|uniref:Uncharacterized protein n=1 Tax=Vibrio ulleungensis TaxID=2807619 RepID=A0ABS2HGX4_9VIBR|nr:hypothetical protein [Vibrio ulleungensis]MBM7035408.1 hypothetical protein [Vibrio ulleungensis]